MSESTAAARVTALHRSGGGVPKLPVARVAVTAEGMAGDWQRNRRFHGGPDRALCIYSQELLDALVAEGHPVFPGAMGENVLVAGLDWRDVRPGTVLAIGAVRCEVTAFAAPCQQLAPYFAEGEFKRVGQRPNPGWSRVYVRVAAGGEIAVGDVVVLEPSA